MLDDIANIFLFFSHDIIIIPFLIIGYIWISRSIFYDALVLILLSMIFNYALKITFKVPLAATVGKEGFAFPSGHMQSATVLYGWIAFKAQNRLIRFLTFILLAGIGFSLIRFGYHNYYDILGALFFATLLMFGLLHTGTKAFYEPSLIFNNRFNVPNAIYLL